ncbi:MAG: hypothetical protein JW864_12915 [Spirochaetes bacterium]|nr:hypothetical protein [Spirochaetota bacterium]
MKCCLYIFIFLFLTINILTAETQESDLIPVYYPEGTVGTNSPYFIWYDKYFQRDKNSDVRYRITINSLNNENKNLEPLIIVPEICRGNYYFYKIPFILKQDKYEYMIERMLNSKSRNSIYFGYMEYPVHGKFTVDLKETSLIDKLPPDKLIKYIQLNEQNRLVNGYNSIFFGTSAVGSFGIGYLFLRVLDFGIISKIVYSIALVSSAAGICASGYYAYKYISVKNELNKILDISNDVSLNVNYSLTETFAGCVLYY